MQIQNKLDFPVLYFVEMMRQNFSPALKESMQQKSPHEFNGNKKCIKKETLWNRI